MIAMEYTMKQAKINGMNIARLSIHGVAKYMHKTTQSVAAIRQKLNLIFTEIYI